MSKVVLLGPSHPFRGGIANFNERLARAFQDEGHHVKIITYHLQYPGFLFPGKTQYSDSPAPAELDIEAAINSIHPFNWKKVGRQLQEAKPDLLIPSFWIPFMGLALAKVCHIARQNGHTRAIALVHNLIPHESRPGDNFFIRYFINRMDGFVTLSNAVVNDIARYDKHKPKAFNPHPIYDHFGSKWDQTEAREKLGLKPEMRYLLFFGIIRKYKGLDLLLEALEQTEVRDLENMQLIVAGEFYEPDKPYLQLIEKYGLEDKVIMKNFFIPDEEVGLYFSASDVVVQPYRSATQSGVTQIAYHFEKPMIVTNVGGLPEIVPHEVAGLVVKPNPADLARAIVHIFDGDNLQRIGQNVAKERGRFGWDRMVATFMDVFGQLQQVNNGPNGKPTGKN